ncbi:MAG: efflux RND transporter periplasmic adaptor subunit [Sphingopyxis sp.]
MPMPLTRHIWLSALVLAMPLSLSACSDEAPPTRDAPAPANVERRLIQATRVTEWKDVGATITSVDMADARARIPGILESLSVREGDLVRRGQVIGRVVDNRLGYEGAAYGAQAAAAQAQAAQAEAELSRIRFLHRNGVYAQARLDQAEAAARAARAGVAAARAQQSAVNAMAGQGAIIAPSSGRVLMAPVPPGSAVGPGVSVATITSGSMIMRLELPETLAGQVHVGSAVIATGMAVAGSPASRASVSRIYPAVTGGQMMADVEMPGLGSTMVGRRVTARVATGEREAIMVPRRFVETRYGIDYVSIIGRGNAVSSVPIQIAPTEGPAMVEILSGVSAGDVLIAPRAANAPTR